MPVSLQVQQPDLLNGFLQSLEKNSSHLQTPLEPHGTMRVLCLNVQNRPTAKHPYSLSGLAEAFLRFTPRVQVREPSLIFLEVSTTSHLFKGESNLLEEALQLARDLGLQAQAAVSDTPYGAQAFSFYHESRISLPGEEREDLMVLPLPALEHLEGLADWNRPTAIEQIISFFYMVGLSTLSDLQRFKYESFRERWGEEGAILWRRLHGREQQVISPLHPADVLKEYVHLDFPLSVMSLLVHEVEKALRVLFLRLQGRCLSAQKLVLTLHCEYSEDRHKIELEPNTPSRNLSLYSNLLEYKLDSVCLENPIRQFEIEILPCSDRNQQFDFFEPRVSDQDRLESLLSLLHQSSFKAGFLNLRNEVLPENTWSLGSRARRFTPLDDKVEREGEALRRQTAYGKCIFHAPRPTRLLKRPRKLKDGEVKRMRLLSRHPIERLEDSWWSQDVRRDYHFAISPKGQCLWIYQVPDTGDYYLHGYFD